MPGIQVKLKFPRFYFGSLSTRELYLNWNSFPLNPQGIFLRGKWHIRVQRLTTLLQSPSMLITAQRNEGDNAHLTFRKLLFTALRILQDTDLSEKWPKELSLQIPVLQSSIIKLPFIGKESTIGNCWGAEKSLWKRARVCSAILSRGQRRK